MAIQMVLSTVDWNGWLNGAIIGGFVGLGVGMIYKFCFGGPGRQA